jgi:FtsH-binding integral membrane protein
MFMPATPGEFSSSSQAIGMYAILVGLPLLIAGLASAYVYRASTHELGLWFSLLVYVVGTLPGIVLFRRFLVTRRSRIIFAFSYAGLSLLGMSVMAFWVGCIITDICL